MTLPTYQAIGTAVEGTGDVSPAWPAHAVGDVALLVIESCGGEAAGLSVAAGFQQVSNSPQSALTGTSGTRITVFWHRATTTSMAAPTVSDPGNHAAAVIVTFRGGITTGITPFDVTAGSFKDVSSTSDTLPGVTTTVIDCLIILLATRNGGTVGGVWNGTYTNGALGSITERHNGSYPSGNGGGILVVTGTKAVAGATGTTAATLLNTQTCAYLTIALKPPRIGGAITGSASAATSVTGRKRGKGAVTGSAAASTTSAGLKSAAGAITGNAAAGTTLTGRRRAKGSVTGSAAASTVLAIHRKVSVGSVTGTADADTSVVGHHVRRGIIVGQATAGTTVVGRKRGRGIIVGLANADTTITGDRAARGAITGLALAGTTIVGRKIVVPVPFDAVRKPPGAVWRLGKMGGGDDYGALLMHVVDWQFTCAWEPEAIGGHFVYPAAVLGPDDTIIDTSTYLYPGAEVACILGGDERRNCRFTLHDPKDEMIAAEDGTGAKGVAHVINWTLLNMFHRLDQSSIRPADDAIILRPKEWQGVSAGTPAQFVVHQSHTDGALTEIQFDFDDAEDSNNVAYEKDVDLTVDRLGPTGLDIIRTEWGLHALDTWFERRRLRVFNPDSMSQNYAGAGTKIVISSFAEDLLDAPRTVESRSRATRVWVRGDEDRFKKAELDPLEFTPADTHTGYLEAKEDASGVKDPAQLQALANAYLEIYKQPRRQITYAINLGGGKDPLIHYQLGDWILKHDGSEVDGKPEKVRVLRCFYSGSQDGTLKAGITVSDWFGELETRTQRKIDGINGNLAGFAKPSRTSVPPSAPIVNTADIVRELVPPEHGGLERVKITVPFGWDGLDADGLAPCGDFDTFLGRYAYDGGHWNVLEIGVTPAVFRDLDPGRNIRLQLGSRDEADNKAWTEDLEP